jgi:hypothetical protein
MGERLGVGATKERCDADAGGGGDDDRVDEGGSEREEEP